MFYSPINSDMHSGAQKLASHIVNAAVRNRSYCAVIWVTGVVVTITCLNFRVLFGLKHITAMLEDNDSCSITLKQQFSSSSI